MDDRMPISGRGIIASRRATGAVVELFKKLEDFLFTSLLGLQTFINARIKFGCVAKYMLVHL